MSVGDAALAARARDGDRLLALVPWLIVAYALALWVLRVSLSGALEVDEAEFVGRVDLRLVYDNSHPPMFNWLARVALELFGWDWPMAIAAVKYGLLAVFHLCVWDAARRLAAETGGAAAGLRAGALAVAASAFLPQIVWMSAVTLAHSIAVMAGAAATVWAAVVALQRPSAAAYLALGLAAAAGALSKFNFGLFLIPFVAAIAWTAETRRLLRDRRVWLAAAAFLAAAGPSYVAALLDLQTSAERIEKLYRPDGGLAAIDPPLLGVDGLVTMVLAGIAWAGPALAIWAAALWRDGRLTFGAARGNGGGAAFLGRSMALSLALFAAMVLLADMHKVEERYLTPLLTPLPVWLAIAWPLARSRPMVMGVAAAAYVVVFAGFWGMANFGKHRFGYPYADIAEAIEARWPEPQLLLSPRHDDRANFVLALRWPGAAQPAYPPAEGAAVMVWRGFGEAPLWLAPGGLSPEGAPLRIEASFINGYDGALEYSAQRFVRSVSE